jgi:hypothetical protein
VRQIPAWTIVMSLFVLVGALNLFRSVIPEPVLIGLQTVVLVAAAAALLWTIRQTLREIEAEQRQAYDRLKPPPWCFPDVPPTPGQPTQPADRPSPSRGSG